MRQIIGLLFFILAANGYAFHICDNTQIFLDLIWWQAAESGAENWAQLISPSGQDQTVQVIDAPFDWNPGIRLGATYRFNPYNYDLTFAYTHYQTHATNHASGPVYSGFLGNYFVNNTNGANFGPTYRHANIEWNIFYNTLDLNLGFNFTFAPPLKVHPYLGLKLAAIKQSIRSHWLQPTVPTNFRIAQENIDNDFFGFGPMLGVDTSWNIYLQECRSLSVIGNVAAGLLWGHWRFNEIYSNNAPINIKVDVNSLNGTAPTITGELGLQWVQQLKQFELSLQLAYEAQIWFNQLQFYSYNMGRLNRPLSLQGFDLTVRLNF